MAYSFWHVGILIGESDLEAEKDHPNHLVGIFRPTAHGVKLLPRLSGILTAGCELKEYFEDNGLDPESLDPAQVEHALETTSGGQRVLELGRTLSGVEVRSPEGPRVEFATIGFSDIDELRALIREMGVDDASGLLEMAPNEERYVVSLTLRRGRVARTKPTQATAFGRPRRWNGD